jgi:hypothetical protein
MAKLKLAYFDFHGGRGEPARLALSIGGIAFKDDRVPTSEWPRRKPNTPFGGLPVLEVDGRSSRNRTQSQDMSVSWQICTYRTRGKLRCATK